MTACSANSQNTPSSSTQNTVSQASSNVPSQAVGNRSRSNRGFGNLTIEQRQQMMQQSIDACQDKNEGDSCILSNTRMNATGTCNTLNATLRCMPANGYRPSANQ